VESPTESGGVVVCGGGAAGLAAAISAARHGAEVLLLEKTSRIGGTVANVLIHTLAGFYDSNGDFINDGLPRELVERLLLEEPTTHRRKMGRLWVVNVCPSAYRQTVQSWLSSQPRIRVIVNAEVTHAVRSGQRIEQVDISCPYGPLRVRSAALIDTTGTAELIRLIDDSLVFDDASRAASGLVLRIRGVDSGALDYPQGLGIVRALRSAAGSGELPSECAHAWLDSGIHPDETFVKLMIGRMSDQHNWRNLAGSTEHEMALQQAVLRFLKRLPGLASIRLIEAGTLGVRDGGRIRGRYVLTGNDVRTGQTFFDGVCRCAWPIEYWDCDYGVSLEYLPTGTFYEIPMRSLQLDGFNNVWVAGKCLSADREAHASARVVGSCWAMGAAAGAAAAGSQSITEANYHESELLPAISRNCTTTA
jgi:hypothetical protein